MLSIYWAPTAIVALTLYLSLMVAVAGDPAPVLWLTDIVAFRIKRLPVARRVGPILWRS